MLIVLSCPWIRWRRANRVVGVLRSVWNFFSIIWDIRPRDRFFFFFLWPFLQKIGVTTRGGDQNARKSQKKLKFTQNVYFDVFLRHSKFHNVWTMFHHFFLHSTILMVFFTAFHNTFFTRYQSLLIFMAFFYHFKHFRKEFFQKTSYLCMDFLKIYGFFQHGRKNAIF